MTWTMVVGDRDCSEDVTLKLESRRSFGSGDGDGGGISKDCGECSLFYLRGSCRTETWSE